MASETITPAVESRAAKTIRDVFATGRPLTYIRSAEEHRVARLLSDVGAALGAPVWTWSLTEGIRRDKDLAEPET